jgi:hypothetical protein
MEKDLFNAGESIIQNSYHLDRKQMSFIQGLETNILPDGHEESKPGVEHEP